VLYTCLLGLSFYPVTRYTSRLSRALNHAMAISMKRNPHSKKSQYVRAVTIVKGVHFYGFHTSYAPFLKVHIADPALVARATTILRSGTVMRTRFRIFESHLNYILQFMADFGLYGCGLMELGEVWQRDQASDESQDGSAMEGMDFRPSPYFRQSRLPVEVDVAAHQILNRHLLTAKNVHHRLTIPGPQLSEEPAVLSVRELWDDERRRRIAKGLPPSPEIPVDPSERSRSSGGDWVAEARWWHELRKRIQVERERNEEPETVDQGWERWVMTTFESVEALWEKEHKAWRPSMQDNQTEDKILHTSLPEENPFEIASGLAATDPSHLQQEDIIDDHEVDENILVNQDMDEQLAQHHAVAEPFDAEDDTHSALGEDEDDPFAEDSGLAFPEDGPPPETRLPSNVLSQRDVHDISGGDGDEGNPSCVVTVVRSREALTLRSSID
jgi:DNA polymerase zeta